MRVLIAYATSTGSTKSIAERISTRLSDDPNITTTLLPISEAGDITSFDALIIGSCIHMGSWIKPATRFVSANAAAVRAQQMPVWAFSVGCPNASIGSRKDSAMKEGDDIRKIIEKDIQLKNHELLEGYWRKEDWNPLMRCLWSCFGVRWGDYRDWEAVDRFADRTGQELNNQPAAN